MVNPHTNCKDNMFYIYILKSRKDRNCYIGSTNNLERRIDEHNKGLVFSTKLRIPFGLIYYEAYKSEGDARKKRKEFKIKVASFCSIEEKN